VRRVLFAFIVGLLIFDATGLESLLLPERCESVADRAADNDCPATCARCACGQPSVPSGVAVVAMTLVHESVFDTPSSAPLSGSPHDVLHIPKTTSLS